MDVRLIQIDQQMLVALGAVQHALELLDKRLSPLRIGPAEQLLGLLPRQLASTTACGGAGPRGSSRGSTSGRSARGPSRPDGARSSVALDQPLRRAERLPCAGRRRPHHEALLRSSRKGGTAAGAAKDESVGATF